MIATVLIGTLIACRPADPETIDNVITLLRNNGYQISKTSEAQVVYIWAVDGIGIDVNGQHILIYEFADDEDAIDRGIEATEKVLQSGTGFWDFNRQATEQPYYVKGKVLVFLGDHPDAGKIRELLDCNCS